MPDFSNPYTDGDLKRLGKLLTDSMRVAGVAAPAGESFRLLNLACGRADETGVLADVFGGSDHHLQLTGIDIRDREIGEAADRWKHLDAGKSTEFLVQDASRLDDVRELGGAFDLAFMRHQNFWNGDSTWTRIYDQALHRLSDNGHLVITSYFDREHQLALDAIQGLGAELVCTTRNAHSRVLPDAPAKSVDRHVAVFRKPS